MGGEYSTGMVGTDMLEAARAAFSAMRWTEAIERFTEAEQAAALEAADLERLAVAAYLAGHGQTWVQAMTRAHTVLAERGQRARASRCAFWIAFGYLNEGEGALGGGWLGRAQRLIDEGDLDCVERGYLLLPAAIEGCERDPSGSLVSFRLAAEIAERFGDRDLGALAQHGQAWCLILQGDRAGGMALLDEVLVSLVSRELSPIVIGDIYCGAVDACRQTFDLRRARAWTAELTRWCEDQPDLVPFRGQCLVYRSGVLQASGAWADAMREARDACTRLSTPTAHPALGAASYQLAELHRLRGEFDEAERWYRQAADHGHSAQPGFALLRLAQGDSEAAAAAIRRVVAEAGDRLTRTMALPAAVEISIAAGDLAGARAAADELAILCSGAESALLEATCAYSAGSVMLAEGDVAGSLAELRRAASTCRDLGAVYEEGRARLKIGQCCESLGDREGAELEWHAARVVFERLGARPDLAKVDARGTGRSEAQYGLSARELEVLRLVARGKTNRAIGEELVISEKTVARHLSNIFAKIGVQTRAAATAYAYDRGLIA
jgi:ATP/maltotriose-dependent transcriptional regulator MalT